MSILAEILAHKRDELDEAKRRVSPSAMRARAEAAPAARGFRAGLLAAGRPRVIAEIKRRSPSRGEIRPGLDPAACARAYEAGGAAALSVLTDAHFFGGALDDLVSVRAACGRPLLRKDFVLEDYQIDESRAAGADAVLLIAAALAPAALAELHACARALGLDALVEVHDERELEIARKAGADLVGINNRNLRSFEVDLAVTERLAPKLRGDALVVAESGVSTPADLGRLTAAGADAFLVGESLMRQPDPGEALRALRGTA